MLHCMYIEHVLTYEDSCAEPEEEMEWSQKRTLGTNVDTIFNQMNVLNESKENIILPFLWFTFCDKECRFG